MIKTVMKVMAEGIVLLAVMSAGFWLGPQARDLYQRWFPPPAYVTGDFSDLRLEAGKPVVIFTTSTCPYCKQARDLLDRAKVDYRDYVVDRSPDAQRRFAALDGKGVPVLFIGDRRITGFREDVILQSLTSSTQ